MKQLTVAVPSYNSQGFLHKCLGSFVSEDGSMDPRLEIIVVNDGSTDNTIGVAREWEAKYPDNIVVVDKENGGHGSGINAGAKAARGRYYKVIDSDDWIVTENLPKILDELEKTQADAVITGFHTVNIASGVVLPYGIQEGLTEAKESSLADFMKYYEAVPAVQSFHGLMYNTEFYRKLGLVMSEKVFFEDQEYAILPFGHVRTVLQLPYFFYEYQIGSSNQSVNFANQAKRASHFLAVMEKMIYYHKAIENIDQAQNAFIIWRLSNAAVSYYATVLVKGTDKAEGRAKAGDFHAYLQENEPEVAQRTDSKYRMMLRLNRIPGASSAYARLFNSKLYSAFKKRWVK